MKSLLEIALAHLDASLAQAQGKSDLAVRTLRSAVAIEDGLTYDEPPAWYLPVRQVLGDALLAAGRPREAEAAFREDLARNRENGWALRGLKTALEKQGKTAEAGAVTARLEKAWPQPAT